MAEPGGVTRALLAIARDLRDDRALAERICRACVVGLDIDGAAISLHTASTLRETLFATDATADLLEDLQFSLGEGACIEAAVTGRPVLVPDMTDTADTSRWPIYADAAMEAGVSAVFALPLQWGTINLGVLDLYRSTPGSLSRPSCWTPAAPRTRPRCSCWGCAPTLATSSPGTSRGVAERKSIRPRAWCWSSSGSAPPTPSPGCAPMRSPSSGSSATSPGTWWPGGSVHQRHMTRSRGSGRDAAVDEAGTAGNSY